MLAKLNGCQFSSIDSQMKQVNNFQYLGDTTTFEGRCDTSIQQRFSFKNMEQHGT